MRPDTKKSPLNEGEILKLKFEAQNQRQLEASSSFILSQIRSQNDAKNIIEKENCSKLISKGNLAKPDDFQSFIFFFNSYFVVSRSFSETTPTPPSDIIPHSSQKNRVYFFSVCFYFFRIRFMIALILSKIKFFIESIEILDIIHFWGLKINLIMLIKTEKHFILLVNKLLLIPTVYHLQSPIQCLLWKRNNC